MDRRTHNKQKAYARQDRLDIEKACEELLATVYGRKFLWELLRMSHVGAQPFSPNALATSFACGELNVGLQIQALIIQVNPAGYALMVQEKADDDRKWRDLERDTDNGSGGDDASGDQD